MPDKYDEAVKYLTENPSEIINMWYFPNSKPAGCLFQYAGDYRRCGCLTQVRAGNRAQTEEITKAIRADTRIPSRKEDITIADLPVFAEWQRRLDKELKRS